MSNPFVLSVAELVHGPAGQPERFEQSGPSPSRIGAEMIAIDKGEEVFVDATLTPISGGVLVDAAVTATLHGQCVRCLRPLKPKHTLRVNQFYALELGFDQGEDEEEGEELPLIADDDTIDIEQEVVDLAGLTFPFNPTCQPECPDDGESDVPAPDGVVDAEGNAVGEDPRIDPRWAGLEKFL
ncbi:DNA-binding protein [Corynebacterium atypicum]|uniref:DNA-binding protein n=1 Tax=Corynebacterium atypicum TaxID=191610 RepID=A0ABM5QMC4_9CORY|nr:DUF177 domain-containing protein [Corynebacterium atypicum]AIG63926.1 DNA-binding protein [Corynebacterium atypicum]